MSSMSYTLYPHASLARFSGSALRHTGAFEALGGQKMTLRMGSMMYSRPDSDRVRHLPPASVVLERPKGQHPAGH